MPSKNVIKTYLENGWYHVYNRGIDKRIIFMDDEDYKIFLYFLKRYLTQPDITSDKIKPRYKCNLFQKIQLIAYCLMPNHFHLLVKQTEQKIIAVFMQALTNSYTRYFNNKYKRVGPLLQGTYRAILIQEENYLLHLTRYIHLNPMNLPTEVKPGTRFNLVKLADYSYSSYMDYLGKRATSWVHPEEILALFKNTQNIGIKDVPYQGFVEEYKEDSREFLKELTLEYEEKENEV